MGWREIDRLSVKKKKKEKEKENRGGGGWGQEHVSLEEDVVREEE